MKRLVSAVIMANAMAAAAATVEPLEHQPPEAVGLSFLLTDGTVMFQGGIVHALVEADARRIPEAICTARGRHSPRCRPDGTTRRSRLLRRCSPTAAC